MKQISLITLTAIMILASPLLSLTGDEALGKFRSRMYGIGKMTGIISWRNESGSTFTGSFKYMSPGNIYIKFSSPGGKTIVSNGKRLWVYDSSSNICGVQDLARGGSGGIASFVNGYLAIVTSSSSSGHILKLKKTDAYYPEVTLFLDGSYMLRKAVLKNKNGGGFAITLTNVDTTASVMKSMFNFNVPANAQVVKNPLNIR